MKLWCFGDSNTYGYDSCGFFGGRYAAPWPELLAERSGFQVINDGKNGRKIPEREYEFCQFQRDAERYNADALIVMLGTNDLLEGATAGEAAARMEVFLNRCNMPMILLISPPPMKRGAWVPDDGLMEESKNLSRQYEALAEQRGIRFADAGKWNITLAYDGVHFTEEGHVRFADQARGSLNSAEIHEICSFLGLI